MDQATHPFYNANIGRAKVEVGPRGSGLDVCQREPRRSILSNNPGKAPYPGRSQASTPIDDGSGNSGEVFGSRGKESMTGDPREPEVQGAVWDGPFAFMPNSGFSPLMQGPKRMPSFSSLDASN